MCDARGSRDVSDVLRRHAASVNVPPYRPSLDLMDTLTAWAQDLARTLLADALPRRWAHIQGVAARARSLASAVGADAGLLEAAAWLHDIGYHPELAATGLHGLDGARYLRDAEHADPMLCRLVAHHSCAVIEAEERGLAAILRREFDLLAHAPQSGRRARARRPAPGRDPRPLRLRSPGQPVDPPGDADDPPGGRPGERQTRDGRRVTSRPSRGTVWRGPEGNARSAASSSGPSDSCPAPHAAPTPPPCSHRWEQACRR